jgi:lysozyme family protein
MSDNFDRAFNYVVGAEGVYSDDPTDPGNWTGGIVDGVGQGEFKGTKYGISAKSYPTLDIRNLTLAQAKEIYKRDYWDRIRLDVRPYGAAICLFDCAVNQGVGAALSILDKVSTSSQPFLVAFQAERALLYVEAKTFKRNGRGWMRRLIRTALEATK